MVFKQKSPISLSLFLCSLSSSAHKIVLWATIELTKLSEKNDYTTNTRSMHLMRKKPCVSCQGDSGCYGEGVSVAMGYDDTKIYSQDCDKMKRYTTWRAWCIVTNVHRKNTVNRAKCGNHGDVSPWKRIVTTICCAFLPSLVLLRPQISHWFNWPSCLLVGIFNI